MKFISLDLLIQYTYFQITNLYYTVLQKKGNLSPRFYEAQLQLTKFSKLKIIHTPGKNLTVADMLSRTFTKEQLQLHQLRHKQLPPQIDFSVMKDNQLKPVHYLVKHEEIKYNQKIIATPFSLIMVKINSRFALITKEKIFI